MAEDSAVAKNKEPKPEEEKEIGSAGPQSSMSMPLVQLVNGKAVVVKMASVSSKSAVDKIKNMMGDSVIQTKDSKMSSLDFKNREATDRWSKEDTGSLNGLRMAPRVSKYGTGILLNDIR